MSQTLTTHPQSAIHEAAAMGEQVHQRVPRLGGVASGSLVERVPAAVTGRSLALHQIHSNNLIAETLYRQATRK